MGLPTCERPTPATPNCHQLDRDLESAGPKGSELDTVGLRCYHTGAVWKVTEVEAFSEGETLLFSPVWIHRVVPSTADATHIGMTFKIDYDADETFAESEHETTASHRWLKHDDDEDTSQGE
jgi:hypothetical protein